MIEPQPVGTLAGDAAQDSVARGAVVARIIGSALRVSLPRTEGAPLTGHPVVTVGGRTLAANLDSASRLSIEGDSSLVGKPCMVRVPEGRRAWVLTLLK